ncbi:MAG: GNAT family N-acetyltransferase [Promethearchaeota archaeon]|nr:MAG: GNAT family N-acetyltransferase [Candidatus Lokiarchaeota archaeon]
MNISFRQALKEDLPQILNIEKESFEEPWPEEIFNLMLKNSFIKQTNKNSHNFYVCEDKNNIIGYIIWEKEYFYEKSKDILHLVGHIINLCVKPEERRKSYGRKIIEFGLKKMIKSELNHCYLEVRESNFTARRLYERVGMRYISKLNNYYLNEDGLVYTIELR